MKKVFNKKDAALILGLVLLGVLTRTVWHIGENVEFVTSIGIISGYFFYNKRIGLFIPMAVMVISDLFIGNTSILIFTWSAYLLSSLFGMGYKKLEERKLGILGFFVNPQAVAFLFTMFFFLWTNFGVVVLGDMYTHDLNGLMRSYYNALPFLRNQLIGNLIIAPILFWLVEMYYKVNLKWKFLIK